MVPFQVRIFFPNIHYRLYRYSAFNTVAHSIILLRAEVSFGLSENLLSMAGCMHTAAIGSLIGVASSVEKPLLVCFIHSRKCPELLGRSSFCYGGYSTDRSGDWTRSIHCSADDGQLYICPGVHESSGMSSVSVVVDCIGVMENFRNFFTCMFSRSRNSLLTFLLSYHA